MAKDFDIIRGRDNVEVDFTITSQIKMVEDFRDELRREIVVFDPLGVRDVGWQEAAMASDEREIDIPFKLDDRKKKLGYPQRKFVGFTTT